MEWVYAGFTWKERYDIPTKIIESWEEEKLLKTPSPKKVVIYIKFCIDPTIFYICCLYYANCYSKSMFTLINGLVKEE
jgi:hypothetical protein